MVRCGYWGVGCKVQNIFSDFLRIFHIPPTLCIFHPALPPCTSQQQFFGEFFKIFYIVFRIHTLHLPPPPHHLATYIGHFWKKLTIFYKIFSHLYSFILYSNIRTYPYLSPLLNYIFLFDFVMNHL